MSYTCYKCQLVQLLWDVPQARVHLFNMCLCKFVLESKQGHARLSFHPRQMLYRIRRSSARKPMELMFFGVVGSNKLPFSPTQ